MEWLWWPFIPVGKITAVAGQMGQAKSLLTTWLAAAVTTGEGLDCRSGGVVMLNAEDDPEDTIRPRLEAVGADLDRVWIEPTVSLDINRITAACEQIGGASLITIDPIQAYLPARVNSWKGQDVRIALEPLRAFASECGIAVLFVQHLNRRSDAVDPLARIADSQGIPQLARSVLIWGPDPSDPQGDHGTMKVLSRAKGNLARATHSATFSITETTVTRGIRAPVLVRGEDSTIDASDIIADHETRTAVDEAVEWLRALLADGPVSAKDGQKQARDVGISERTLKRARKVAGVVAEPGRDDSAISGWSWRLAVVPRQVVHPGLLGG